MPEDGNRNALAAEKLFQVADQLADACGRHDDIIDEIDRLFTRIEAVERGVQRLAGFPQLLALLGIKGRHHRRGQRIAPAHRRHSFRLLMKIAPRIVGIQLGQ